MSLPSTDQPFICPPDHRHSEVETCYARHKCRCEPCCINMRAIDARRRALKRTGITPETIPQPLPKTERDLAKAEAVRGVLDHYLTDPAERAEFAEMLGVAA